MKRLKEDLQGTGGKGIGIILRVSQFKTMAVKRTSYGERNEDYPEEIILNTS